MNIIHRFLLVAHVLGFVVWVGGMFMTVHVLRPAVGQVLPAESRLKLMSAVLARFFKVVWVAMPVVVLSGWIMLLRRGADGPHSWLAMGVLGSVMGLIFVWIWTQPYQSLRTALAGNDHAAAGKCLLAIQKWVRLNLALGALCLFFGAAAF